jgi:hypothetical protein
MPYLIKSNKKIGGKLFGESFLVKSKLQRFHSFDFLRLRKDRKIINCESKDTSYIILNQAVKNQGFETQQKTRTDLSAGLFKHLYSLLNNF